MLFGDASCDEPLAVHEAVEVLVRALLDGVRARSALHQVAVLVAYRVQGVVAGPRVEGVPACVAVEDVGALPAVDRALLGSVVAGAAVDLVVAGASAEAVVARVAVEEVVAALADQGVAAPLAGDCVALGGARECLGPGVAHDGSRHGRPREGHQERRHRQNHYRRAPHTSLLPPGRGRAAFGIYRPACSCLVGRSLAPRGGRDIPQMSYIARVLPNRYRSVALLLPKTNKSVLFTQVEGVFSEVGLLLSAVLRSSRLRNADIRSRFTVSHPRL